MKLIQLAYYPASLPQPPWWHSCLPDRFTFWGSSISLCGHSLSSTTVFPNYNNFLFKLIIRIEFCTLNLPLFLAFLEKLEQILEVEKSQVRSTCFINCLPLKYISLLSTTGCFHKFILYVTDVHNCFTFWHLIQLLIFHFLICADKKFNLLLKLSHSDFHKFSQHLAILFHSSLWYKVLIA